MRPSQEHEDIVDRLLSAGCQSGNFRARIACAVALAEHPEQDRKIIEEPWEPSRQQRMRRKAEAIFQDENADAECFEVAWWQAYQDLVIDKNPDAYDIRSDLQEIVVHEVVVTSDLKPQAYAGLWFYLDAYLWGLELQVHSHHGATSVYTSKDLMDLWYQAIGQDQEEQPRRRKRETAPAPRVSIEKYPARPQRR